MSPPLAIPTPAEVAARAARLKAALLGGVTEADMAAVMKALATQAAGGRLEAVRLLLAILGPLDAAPPPARLAAADPAPDPAAEKVVAVLADRGPLRLADVQRATGLTFKAVQAVLAGPWFAAGPAGYDLTPAGRAAALLGGDSRD